MARDNLRDCKKIAYTTWLAAAIEMSRIVPRPETTVDFVVGKFRILQVVWVYISMASLTNL